MKIERLEELQQSINALRSINPEEGAALIGEIWRLRTAQTGKELEVSCLKDGHDWLKAELDRISEANRLLQAENDRLKSTHGLLTCDLENRWSNCAVLVACEDDHHRSQNPNCEKRIEAAIAFAALSRRI